MTTTINALNRGGFSAYGEAEYDPRSNEVVVRAYDEDETRAISVVMPSAISSISKSENGVTSTTPSISSATFTATLSDMSANGYVTYQITLSSGPVVPLTVRAKRMDAAAYSSDYGRWP